MEEKLIPEVQEIAEYLRVMKFKKKVVGGCDKDDVLMHMEKVTQMYDKVIDSQIRKSRELERRLQKRRAKSEEENRVRELTEEIEKVPVESKESGEDQNATLERVLAQLDNAKAEVIRKAQAEANNILRDAKLRASEEEQRIEKLRMQRISMEKEYKLKVFETKESIRKTKVAITKYHKDFQEMLDTLSLLGDGNENIIDLEVEKSREQGL